MRLQYGLASLTLVFLFTCIVVAGAAPLVRRILDDYELVGVQLTPVGYVVLILLVAMVASGVACVVCRGCTKTRSR